MAIIRIEYKTKELITSCLPSETELQAGEQVKITHNGADPLWNPYIKAHLALPAYTEDGERVYLLDFDDAQLGGGAVPSPCDLDIPLCWSCCDVNEERFNNLVDALVEGGVIINNGDGTFTPAI